MHEKPIVNPLLQRVPRRISDRGIYQEQRLADLFPRLAGLVVGAAFTCVAAPAADLTYFSWSDTHYLVEDSGGRATVNTINNLAGTAFPAAIGGTVGTPRGIVMQGDLINDGALADKYPAQWANYIADFGVNGEGRCKVPVFEGLGNHDLSVVFDQIAARNVIRKNLGLIDNVSTNGYHYSWDWDGVHFVNLNLFTGNIWLGEADAYGSAHNPRYSRDFLVQDLQDHVGNSGRPVVVIQHFRPIDDNWWTYSAADKLHKALQDYNVIVIMVGHQGGSVINTWRGINWASSNGVLDVYRISPDNKLSIAERSASAWGTVFQKNIYLSYATSGLAAAVNNGEWATSVTPTSANLSGKLLYQALAPTEVTVYWGTIDGGTGTWQNSRNLGVQAEGSGFSAEVSGLQPWTNYFYRCRATNSQGSAWAATSIPFTTAGTLPAAWGTRFLGYEQRPWGGAQESSGTFTVRGSGRNIGEAGQGIDNFQYAYRSLDGDGEIKARIATPGTNTASPKVGVMLREALTEDSRHAAVLLGKNEGLRFMARSSAGGSTSASTNNTLTAPYWVKLVRSGNTFTGFTSPDGEAWTQAGTPATLAMPSNIFAGLAVSAGNSNSSFINASTFDNVVLTGANLPMPPTISNVADQIVSVNASTGALAFSVSDLETAPSLLTLTSTSSNTTLVPGANIVFGGSGTQRSVTVTPAAGLTGSATITLTVSDGTLTSSESFLLTVLAGQVFAGQWQSLGEHGATARGMVIADLGYVEPRQTGIRRLEVSFSDPIILTNPATALTVSGVNSAGALNPASLGISVNVSAADNLLAITFASGGNPVALPDAAKWRFTLNTAAITGAGGLVLSPSAATTRVLSGLVGDFDGNGRVTGLDLNRISNTGAFDPATLNCLRADIDGDAQLGNADLDAAWANRAKRTDTLASP